jgi:hypothetical protein
MKSIKTMKNRLFLFLSLLLSANILAQNTDSKLIGNYFITGVREMASGFQLNADHSFQFYFSYGALDRSGEGTWAVYGDSVVFNSNKKQALDFKLEKSEKRKANGITIKVSAPDTFLAEKSLAQINNGQLQRAEKGGLIYFGKGSVQLINLFFEFCPEKISKFQISDLSHNYFEFNLLPTIFDVHFENYKLKINQPGFTGKHLLLGDKEYEFVKEK